MMCRINDLKSSLTRATQIAFNGVVVAIATTLSVGCGGGGDGGSTTSVSPAPASVVKCDSAATAGVAPGFNGKQTLAVCPNLFVDPSIAVADRAQISNTILNAVERDRVFYGSLVAAPPDVIVCATAECGAYFAGPTLRNTTLGPNNYVDGASFVAPRTTIVITGIAADTENVLTHEGSHVEVAARLGNSSVPAWFSEGLATFVGAAPDCTGVIARAFTDLRQVDAQAAWNTRTNDLAVFLPAYCQARSEFAAWIGARPAGATLTLLTAVKSGTPFYTAYGPFLTQ